MPSYFNSNNSVVYVEGLRLPPHETVETNQFIQSLPAGVSKTSDLPAYNPVISSTKYTGSSGSDTVSIASAHNDFSIRIRVVSGAITVNLGSASVTPALTVLAGEQVEFISRNRSINALVLTYLEASVAKVDIFAPASMSWSL